MKEINVRKLTNQKFIFEKSLYISNVLKDRCYAIKNEWTNEFSYE